jgi:hypothetical protein
VTNISKIFREGYIAFLVLFSSKKFEIIKFQSRGLDFTCDFQLQDLRKKTVTAKAAAMFNVYVNKDFQSV